MLLSFVPPVLEALVLIRTFITCLEKKEQSYCIIVAALFQIQKNVPLIEMTNTYKVVLNTYYVVLNTMPNLTMVFLNMLAKKILRIKWKLIVTLCACKS